MAEKWSKAKEDGDAGRKFQQEEKADKGDEEPKVESGGQGEQEDGVAMEGSTVTGREESGDDLAGGVDGAEASGDEEEAGSDGSDSSEADSSSHRAVDGGGEGEKAGLN